MKAYFETTVLVASSIEAHVHYPQAAAALRSVHQKRLIGCVSTHGLAETYAVLSRAPFNPPIHPSEAWQIISQNVLAHFEVHTLTLKDYQETIRACANEGRAGGRIYDALHLRAARRSGCEQVYTFDVRHFRELAPDLSERIRVP